MCNLYPSIRVFQMSYMLHEKNVIKIDIFSIFEYLKTEESWANKCNI